MDTGVGRQKGEAVKNIADIDPLELARRRPEWSAAQPMTRQQKRAIVAIVLVIVVALIFAPLRTAQILIGFCTLFYVISTLYKFAVIRASLSPSAIMRFSPEEIASVEPREWPIYSILVPMYKEPETLKQMLNALIAMDYPADKKDVQFLLEEDI